jgi:hypothetical protein
MAMYYTKQLLGYLPLFGYLMFLMMGKWHYTSQYS